MRAYLLLPTVMLLSGCNWIMNVSGLAAESNKAIGASCRQTGRSLEECYSRNPEADKAQIYAGWREMQEYMAKNKLETMVPLAEPVVASAPEAASASHAEAPAQKKSSPLAGGASVASAVATRPIAPPRRPLSNEEAEALAKNAPLLDSILSTVRGDEKPKPPPKDEQAARDNRLLNILNNINSSQPAASRTQPAKPAGSH